MPARDSNPRPSACKAEAQINRQLIYRSVTNVHMDKVGRSWEHHAITNTTIRLTRTLEQEINYLMLNHVSSIWVQLSRKWDHASYTLRTCKHTGDRLHDTKANWIPFVEFVSSNRAPVYLHVLVLRYIRGSWWPNSLGVCIACRRPWVRFPRRYISCTGYLPCRSRFKSSKFHCNLWVGKLFLLSYQLAFVSNNRSPVCLPVLVQDAWSHFLLDFNVYCIENTSVYVDTWFASFIKARSKRQRGFLYGTKSEIFQVLCPNFKTAHNTNISVEKTMESSQNSVPITEEIV